MEITNRDNLERILLTRHYLIQDTKVETKNIQYLNAYLLANFGIVVDKPALLTGNMIAQIDREFHLNVPKSFYSNPQDMQYFTKDELLVEQIVSYFFGYGTEQGRIEVFKKDLPEYVVGDELKLRTFYIVTEDEADNLLFKIAADYCSYTRPWSVDELHEFVNLYEECYYDNTEIKCRDNIMAMLPLNASFARFLDKKDIVKLSIQKFGDKANFKQCFTDPRRMAALQPMLDEIAQYIPYVKHCPMSKKQAKYYNKIVSLTGLDFFKMTNDESPDRLANQALARGDVVAAARVYAAHGSMLERHIRMLLSRANPMEAVEILNMLQAKNPIVLYQLVSNLTKDDDTARTFTFFRNNKVRVHRETQYEATYRKSRLNDSTRKFLSDVCIEKIKEYYRNLPSLGKVYVADNFYGVGIPTNTSASGKGIDVLPTGSRMHCNGSKVRTFVHWKDAFDIDSSLMVVDKAGNVKTMGWFSYCSKPFGNDILFSGDITGPDGAEYFDINLDALAANGYKYVVQTFHGYCSKLNSGEIYAGYQNKENFNTKAWDPKNIEMQFKVYGDSRACVAFAIDIETREVIILNQIIDDDSRVVTAAGFKTIEKFLQPDYLKVNVGMIVECRGELVDDPAEADVIFDDSYVQVTSEDEIEDVKVQQIVRSWETEKLVAFVNN